VVVALALVVLAAALLPGCAHTTRARTEEEPIVTVREPLVYYRLETTMGPVLLELDAVRAAISVENFAGYAQRGAFDGTIFHRVIPGFVPTTDPIANEWQNGLSNVRGSIAMARLSGDPDSATSQFFFNLGNNRQLDVPAQDNAGYAVFGRVVHGMNVVDAIGRVETNDVGRFADVPVQPVRILAVSKLSPAHADEIIRSNPGGNG
jgi:cyclophilin family peptidyl-prolyl cis-trans isomerase